MTKECLYCNKNFTAQSLKRRIYCSMNCSTKHQMMKKNEEYITKWKNGEIEGTTIVWRQNKKTIGPSDHVRTYLFKRAKSSCEICGFNKQNPYINKVMLEIDHIDGNPLNNKHENLRLICPNCHSLTPTYRNIKRK